MVILKNIKKTNNMISADYYPEGKGPKGFMRIEDGKLQSMRMQALSQHRMFGMN